MRTDDDARVVLELIGMEPVIETKLIVMEVDFQGDRTVWQATLFPMGRWSAYREIEAFNKE